MTEKNLDHEKQQEVDTPKFAPQKVKILVQGYGAEICCGSLTKEQYDFWSNNKYSDFLKGHMFGYGDGPEIGIPDSAMICEGGAYHEVSDLYHDTCPFVGGASVIIEDKATGKVIDEYELSFEENNKLLREVEKETGEYPDDKKVGILIRGEDIDCVNDSMKNGHYAMVCSQSNERGTYHKGIITLTRPYKRGDIQFTWSEINKRDSVVNTGCMYLEEDQLNVEMAYNWIGKGYDCYIEKNYALPENQTPKE